MMKTKKYLFYIIILVIIPCTPVISHARNRAVWISGRVTSSPWMEDSSYHMKVNNVLYTIRSNIRVTYRYERNKGAFDERKSSVSSIFKGQTIMIKAKNNEIIQIILF